MHHDTHHQDRERSAGLSSIARRREILKRIGKSTAVAGVAASPLSALATGGRRWCKHPVDTTKCVHASISGMASVLLSAQASDEVCSKKCSHYSSSGNWPSTCHNGSVSVTCNSSFATAFNCPTVCNDSNGLPRTNLGCLLNKSMLVLCTTYQTSQEAHWATALANANKLAMPVTGAAFPYTPGQVVGYYQNAGMRASAYAFFKDYCEQYA